VGERVSREAVARLFEHLTGNQVVVQTDGSKHLVASASYPWPEPTCGGEPLPLFGGEDCVAAEGQLQGSSLEEAMTEVMGALTRPGCASSGG
jgi:hypothetical protein